MRAKIYLIAALLVISSVAYSQLGSIRAKVVDEDGKPVYMANVTLKTNKIVGGQTTDFDGWFHFKALTPGYYNVEVSFIGYHTSKIQKINVTAGRITFLETVVLKGESELIDETIVYANKLIDPEAQGEKLNASGSAQVTDLPGHEKTVELSSITLTDSPLFVESEVELYP